MQSRALNSSTVGDEHETQLRQLLGRHADASIGHAELEPVASVDDLSHPQCDLPLLGELAGIAQQIEQDLPQPHWDRAITAVGARLLYLPPYSPDLNPIELAISKVKADLRKACERTIPRLSRRIGRIVADFSAKECRNFFRHAGYVRI